MAAELLGFYNPDTSTGYGTITSKTITGYWSRVGKSLSTPADSKWTIEYIKVKMRRTGTVGDALFKITEAADVGFPTGVVLGSTVYDASGVTTDAAGEWYQINFSPAITIDQNTWFGIVIEPNESWSEDSGHYLYWRTNTAAQDGEISPAYNVYAVGTPPSWPAWSAMSSGKKFLIEIWGTELGAPEKPTTPSPGNGIDTVVLDQETISWEDGGGATSYDVWYGENEAGLTKVSAGQEGTSFTISGIDYGSPFGYVTSRTWRIDAINAVDTTTGDVWTFTTIIFAPPQVTYVLIDGGNEQGPYDDPPGVEGTDWNWTGGNNMIIVRRLVAAANDAIWYESI